MAGRHGRHGRLPRRRESTAPGLDAPRGGVGVVELDGRHADDLAVFDIDEDGSAVRAVGEPLHYFSKTMEPMFSPTLFQEQPAQVETGRQGDFPSQGFVSGGFQAEGVGGSGEHIDHEVAVVVGQGSDSSGRARRAHLDALGALVGVLIDDARRQEGFLPAVEVLVVDPGGGAQLGPGSLEPSSAFMRSISASSASTSLMASVGQTWEQRVSVQPSSMRWAQPVHFWGTLLLLVPVDGAVGAGLHDLRMTLGLLGVDDDQTVGPAVDGAGRRAFMQGASAQCWQGRGR